MLKDGKRLVLIWPSMARLFCSLLETAVWGNDCFCLPLTTMQMPAELQMEQGYPDMLQHFHSLYPLDDLKAKTEQPSRALGVQSWILKGISMHDGAAFAIRRFSWRQVTFACLTLLSRNQS